MITPARLSSDRIFQLLMGKKVAAMSVKTLESLRTEDSFKLFWVKAVKMVSDIGVDEPVLPRRRKAPKRYRIGNSEGEFAENVGHVSTNLRQGT